MVPSLPALGKASQQRAAVGQLRVWKKELGSLERRPVLNFGVSVSPKHVHMDEKTHHSSRSGPGTEGILSLTGLG